MRRTLLISSAALLLAAATAHAATPEDTIKYRKAVMSTMAGHINAITLIFTGRVEHEKFLLSHAEALAVGGEQMGVLFPAGSDVGRTEALPAIWQEPEKFAKAVEQSRLATAGLRDAIRTGDKAAIGKAMKPVADSCKGCHDRYRKEEQSM